MYTVKSSIMHTAIFLKFCEAPFICFYFLFILYGSGNPLKSSVSQKSCTSFVWKLCHICIKVIPVLYGSYTSFVFKKCEVVPVLYGSYAYFVCYKCEVVPILYV